MEHASRLSCTAQERLSSGRHSEPRPVAECSPRPLRFRSAPLSATEALRRMTLPSSFRSLERCCERGPMRNTYHHGIKDICVALYVVANDSGSCSKKDTVCKEEGHVRTPVTARLQHSARVDDLLADPCPLVSCTDQPNAHTSELFSRSPIWTYRRGLIWIV